MNPGVGGSNPLVDTIFSIKINALGAFSPILLHYSSGFATNRGPSSRVVGPKHDLFAHRSIIRHKSQYVSKTESFFLSISRIPFQLMLTSTQHCAINIAIRIWVCATYALNISFPDLKDIFKTNQFTDFLSEEVLFIHIGRSR